jgi:uncharacterized protein (DUF342 family)
MGKPPEERVPKVEIASEIQGDGWKLLLVVSADKLTASVQIVRSSSAAECPKDKVVAFVHSSGLRLSKEEEARLPGLARTLTKGASGTTVIVAKGVAAQTWQTIDWLIPMGISLLRDYSNETVDLHDVSHFINVRAGQVLCELPPTPKSGLDVYGELLAAQPCPYNLGDRVAIDSNHSARVIATQPGCVRFVSGRLSVEQHLEIPGDLNFKVGNIDFCGDVTIHGSVLDGFQIKSAKNVVIDGNVGAAPIEAAGDITIKGGVNGGHKGRLQSGGNLHAHYLHMVTVECGGDVLADIECHDSVIVAQGSVTITQGGIIGGQVLAGTDIFAGFLGVEMCVPTIVHAGYNAGTNGRVCKARADVAHARALVGNLEATLADCAEKPGFASRFPGQRKTQVIQLQSRLADARLVAKRAHAELAGKAHGCSPTGAAIVVGKQVFPKVTLVIDSVCEEESAIDRMGPLRLMADCAQFAIKAVSGKRPVSK